MIQQENNNEQEKPVITSTILLRKLTFKSRIGFGKNEHLTVKDVINVNNKYYLIWVYYNMSKITFIDDVLDAIGIKPSDRIDKPGKDIKKGDEVLKTMVVNQLEEKLTENKDKFIEYFEKSLKPIIQ